MAGFGSLQEFLETGYRRFHEIDEPGRFLDDLARLLEHLTGRLGATGATYAEFAAARAAAA